eukprot:gene3342-17345_t
MPTASGDGTTFGFENPVYDGVTTDGDDYLAVDAAPETKRGKGGALSHGNHGDDLLKQVNKRVLYLGLGLGALLTVILIVLAAAVSSGGGAGLGAAGAECPVCTGRSEASVARKSAGPLGDCRTQHTCLQA